MGRFKILGLGTLLVIGFIMVNAMSLPNETALPVKVNSIIEESKSNPKVSKEDIALYKLRQQNLHKALKIYFENAIKVGDIVGAGVSIVHKDSIVISEGFGKRKAQGELEVDGETVFRLGSLSKGFAGVLAASFQSEGKFDFEDKVTDYIPEFQFGDRENTDKIKVKHILSHSTGAPYHSFTNLIEAGLPIAEIAKKFKEVTPQSEPGKQYSYQNAMFALSQEVLLKATGQEMKTALQTRFFRPLGMSHISMDHQTLLNENNVALPHVKRRNGWKSISLRDKYYNAVAAGGINASALDMAKWMRFLLGNNPEVLSKATIQKVFKPVISIDNNNKYYQRWSGYLNSYYGFGWRIHNYKESPKSKAKTMWHHGGSVNSYRNEVALFPESNMGVCVLLNSNSRIAKRVIPDLYDIIWKTYHTTY